MLPALQEEAGALGLGWTITAGDALPSGPVDWLVCFKSIPKKEEAVAGSPRRVFLVCDQLELFWRQLDGFDAAVATSSRPFAKLLAATHPDVTFLGESEPLDYLAFGEKNLATPPAQRGNGLLWHGGNYSLDALLNLRPVLESLAKTRDIRLHVVSGRQPARMERWGGVSVHFFPWSKEQLFQSAAEARLGLIPARGSIRNSWLKPGSRVRCLYALGVPAIGDGRVPDAVDFLREFNGPAAASAKSWARRLGDLWDAPEQLARLAEAGHAAVARNHSTRQTARRWIRFFSSSFHFQSSSNP
jgi:glycosyltransferase involved in cell wall biosynthesis